MLFDPERADQLLFENDLDALVAGTPENYHYVSNFPEPFKHVGREYLSFAVYPLDGKPFVVTNETELHQVERYSWIDDHRFYSSGIYVERDYTVDSAPSAEVALREALEERGIAGGTLGTDRGYLLCRQWDAVSEMLPNATLRDAADLFFELRSVKTAEEVERVRRATEHTEAGISAFLKNVRAGVSEMELKRQVEIAVAEAGGEFYKHHPGQLALGAGGNGANGTAQPSEYVLQDGDVARIDLGAIQEGYTSDVARVTTVGEPSNRVREYYDAVVSAQQSMIDHVEPGVTTGELFELGLSTVHDHGFPEYDRGHLGHGVGLHHHEPPLITEGNDRELEPNMVLAVEVPFHVDGFAGFNVEDIVLVTEDGHEVIADIGYELDG